MPPLSIILAAGGIGRRMGSHIPKQLLKIGDISILELTLKRFIDLPQCDEIIIPTPKEYIYDIPNQIHRTGFECFR